ncbi:type I restriction enzyme M protein [Bradyrhizobium erythrophlei]|nr:type I restriction enzyme M protein [Bradyrhizobium erythrophlei]
MLDTNTRRRIDTARDILVGKVPDPKSQVEQITIALIYKFMDDMDAEAEELGGKRKFFTGQFARYGWAQLMRADLGGHEMLGLYAEGITKMPENPGIPPLFRDIFKNAYLPYRDPETLKAFLKIIDEFNYDHSERLGDAFEYLLSVLGSQGDAGQFRTPRHIIDFIVEILDPKKNESVLDPACGTAGFLISAYKHILKTNSSPEAVGSKNIDATDKAALDSSTIPPSRGDLLTPDERGKLATNFKGYDISPDMVRLSLVNLYLHGFTDPHIFEYDTLTSEERWNEFADVILANPPFMSPKGGIKPHRRFSIQAKRSEVLFVDYMAEHLTPTGRAGIIVPEGIIFQSQTAYSDLRRMLVENSLVAVVSLPAGCFNPYSGVKTSILILDKSIARQSEAVAFFKVENDGFGLGAQRRAIKGSDLPQIKVELSAYLGALQRQQSTADLRPARGSIVPKEKIAASGDYNLNGDRYREGRVTASSWPFVPVGNVFRKSGETVLPASLNGPITYLGLENITQNTGNIVGTLVAEKPADIQSLKNLFKPHDILYGKLRPNLNKVWLADRKGICSTDIFVIEAIDGATEPTLYAHLFRGARFNDAVMGQLKGAQLPRIGWSSFAALQIPLPPLQVQKEIAAEIDGYQKVINGARAVIDNYRPHIPVRPDWPILELSEITTKITDGAHFTPTYVESGVPFLRVTDITESNTSKKFIPKEEHDELIKRCHPEKGDVLYSKNGTIGVAKLVDWDWDFSIFVSLCLIKPKRDVLNPHYLTCFLNSDAAYAQATAKSKSGTVTNLHLVDIKTIKIPLPPLAVQEAIVAEIEAEQELAAANRKLVERFEQKVEDTLDRIWGGEAPAVT